ncbi:non-ribosomal peptide synthetase [Vibrio mangrovi]|uniref:Non-ribosomal peptide synthetase n=1 Tax=Vibrio mangrovi TaxID=474394 RepID=A0A1Y6IQM9_9VIBR|nr:non-ribosomal peptide synthetase [Vibrio mangrovi]MDW6003283.1 non-ribosomal peptide synthetase [Vibrio mangrovi]SMR99928.1 Tyrocidine synthase 3 [Vibrio mangrovi]
MDTISLGHEIRHVSSNQSALWFLYQLAPASPAYNVYFTSMLGEPGGPVLQPELLEQSFYQAVHQHESMRTGYFQQGEKVCARLFDAQQAAFVVEHGSLTEEECRDWTARSADQPFLLEEGYVLRANLLIGEEASYLTVTAHHIAGDFYGMERFMQTWAEYYTHLSENGPAPQSTEQYSHWLSRQESWLQSEAAQQATDFWQNAIGEVPDSLEIPTDFERPEVRCFDGDEWVCDADQELADAIFATAKAFQVTPYVLLLSAFQFFLHRLSGQTRFLIGSPTSGRRGRRDRDVVGYCVNPVPVLADFSENISFAGLVRKNSAFLKASLPHQKLPFARLTQALMKTRSADRSGLTSHMLTYTQTHELDFCRPLVGPMLESGQRGAAHELNLGVYKFQAGELSFHWRFNTSLYREETVAAMADDFFALLTCLTAAPESNLSDLNVMAWLDPATEHDRVSHSGSATALGLWQQRAADEIALLHHDQKITVGELNQAADSLLLALDEQGVAQSNSLWQAGPMAVLLPRGKQQVAAMLAAWKSGTAYVPLDDKLPAARLQVMLAEAQVSACFGLGSRPEWLAENILWLDVATVDSSAHTSPVKAVPVREHHGTAHLSSTAYMIFTSGSTGTPKAVAVGHRALASYVTALNQRLNLQPGSVYASLASIATDLSYTALWGGLLGGFPVRVLDEEWMLDAEGLADHLQNYPVDMLKVVPSHLQGLLASERDEILPKSALVLGGEGVTPALIAQVRGMAPALTLFNHYGPTETTVGVLAGKLADNQPVSLGTPLAGNRVYVLDERMSPVPVGGIGQLYVAGNQLAEGYWQDSAKTAENFIENPLVSGETIYRTGDRVRRLPQARLQFIGRGDGQVKIRGYRVELAEIERKLAELDQISEAAVYFEKDDMRESLIAFVVSPHSPTVLAEALAGVLPAYMMPHFWQPLEHLPRNSNGKIDRKALREQAGLLLSGALSPETQSPESALSADSVSETALGGETLTDATTGQLVALFAQVLQLDSQSVDPQAGFFSLGGDSILALQLVAAARKAALPLTPQAIFQHQSPAALAAFLAPLLEKENAALKNHAPAPENTVTSKSAVSRRRLDILPEQIECGEVTADLSQPDLEQITGQIAADTIEDILPLSPGQQGIFYHCLLENDPSLYTNVTGMSLAGRIEPFEFLQAWKSAGLRHDILRSRFIWEGLEQPLMVVCRGLAMATDYQDWQHLSADDQAVAFNDFLQQESRNGFDIGRAPLMRVTLIHFGGEQFRLVWTRHHLVVDGWTSALIAGEAIALYRQETLADAPTLEGYSQWLISGDETQAMAYWQQELAGIERPTTLARAAAVQDGNGQQYRQSEMSADLLAQLEQQARAHNLTVNTLLQLGWAFALNRATGQRDVVFGSTTSGRSEAVPDIQQTAGMFINTLPQRVRLEPQTSVQELARKVQLSAAGARNADYLSLAQIQSSLALQPGEALFDTVLVYQNYPFPPALAGLESPKIGLLSVAEHSNLPLMLQMEPGDTLKLHCRYDSRRISDGQITALLNTFEQALNILSQTLTRKVAEVLTALVQAESGLSVLNGSRPTSQPEAVEHLDLIEHIQSQASRTPEKEALIAADRRYTYAALVEAIETRAAVLARMCKAESVQTVAVALPRDSGLVIHLLALYRAGITYIPLDPTHPAERLESILEQSEAEFLLVSEPMPLKSTIHQITPDELKQAEMQETEAVQTAVIPSDDMTAYSIFTSGSTGKPKGVQISRGALRHFMRAIAAEVPVAEHSRLLAVTTIGFDIAALELFLPLLQGGVLVLASESDCKDAQAMIRQITAHQINVMQATPATWHGLAEYEGAWWNSLNVLSGGEALPKSLAEKLLLRANCLTNLYGPTEATIWASCEHVSSASLENLPTSHVTIGQPLRDTGFYILDELQQPVRTGVEGELYISGQGLAQGYLNRAELTAEKFVANPLNMEPGVRMYRTGDRVMMDKQQRIHYLGRMDFQVKLRGFRIELGEIEALLQQHDAVKEAVVVLWDAQQDSAFIAAYVTLSHTALSQKLLSSQEDWSSESGVLTAYLAEHLPAYMVPAVVQVMEQLPLNTNGKINRQALPYPAAGEASRHVAPTTETERTLAEIWQQILNVTDIGVEDNFFHLGGNSLSATRLQARIQRTFHQSLSLAEIFQNPTISAIAEKLAAVSSQEDDLAMMAALLDEFEL